MLAPIKKLAKYKNKEGDIMHQSNIYFDYYNNEIDLTADELKYFTEIVNKIKSKLNYDGKILNSNFELFDDKKVKDYAVGICFKNENDYRIFIDNYFIHECYEALTKDYIKTLIENKTIESVICHELAHIKYWNHCKKHKELTEKYIKMIK